jgi:hypothetical protein
MGENLPGELLGMFEYMAGLDTFFSWMHVGLGVLGLHAAYCCFLSDLIKIHPSITFPGTKRVTISPLLTRSSYEQHELQASTTIKNALDYGWKCFQNIPVPSIVAGVFTQGWPSTY